MAYPTLQKKRSLTPTTRPGAWAQGTREMLSARPDLIPSQSHLDEIGSTSSQAAGRTMAGANAMALQGRDALQRGLGAIGAVGSRSYGNVWQPELAVGLSMPEAPETHPLYASPPSTNVARAEVSPDVGRGRMTEAGRLADRSNALRRSPQFQAAVALNRQALYDAGTPTVRIEGTPSTRYNGMTLDEMAGGDRRRAFRQQQMEQLGLVPQADRNAMRVARAQGRTLSPQMAAMQRADPVFAAIVGEDPASAATFATNREQMDPQYMDRQARGMAMQALFGAVPGAADPAAAAAALPAAVRAIQPPSRLPGQPAVAGQTSPVEQVRSYMRTQEQLEAFEAAYRSGDVGQLARVMQDGGVPEGVAAAILRSASGNQYSSYNDPAGDWWITRLLKGETPSPWPGAGMPTFP